MPSFTYRGADLHYLAHGSGAGRLVVVLPGNSAAAAAHEAQLPVLAGDGRAVALDYLGTGRSARIDRWPEDWWGEAARQVEALLDHLGRESALLVGTSGGAVVALRAAAAFPERVAAVVADSFSARFDRGMLRRNVLAPRSAPSEDQQRFWRSCHGPDWRAVVDADTRVLEALAERGGRWLDVDLSRIEAPVLLTGSMADPAIPTIAMDHESLVGRIPNARSFLIEEGSHPLMWTRPERFFEAALPFLAAAAEGSCPDGSGSGTRAGLDDH